MKRFYLTMLSVLTSVAMMFGQGQYTNLSGSYDGQVKYVAGKNAYPLDKYKLDYTYKIVMGDPYCFANVSWTRNNSYTVNKKSVNYQNLKGYEDLKQRFDLLVPDSAVFTYTILFYSETSKCYIASAKTSVAVPYIEKAGQTVAPTTPVKKIWKSDFTNVVIGKQTKEKPGTVIADASLSKAFEADRITVGKLANTERGFGFRLRKIFAMSSRIDVVNVTASFKWSDDNFNYISDEYTRRVNADKLRAAGNNEKSVEAYFANRKYSPAVGTDSPIFWMTTSRPTDIWMNAITEGDRLYSQQKWTEASAYYSVAAKAAPDLVYPVARVEKIKKFTEYKSNRNVGDLELVYVEGQGSLKSFYMSKMEITQAQWMRVMGTRPFQFKGGPHTPVENISWEDAQAYIAALNKETGMNYRLPRLEEWEYAAKGGAKGVSTEYAGGNNLPDVAWCVYNSNEAPHEVGTKTPNELGLYDMTGNVSEWVVDQYDKDTRFVKGGSWADDASNSVVSSTEKVSAKYKSGKIGFRVCQDE